MTINKTNIIYKTVNEIIPYINNPRNNDVAVDAVASSIAEFGFKVPIVLDSNNVIINGHTRLKAAKKLGLKEVPCIIADDLTNSQIKAFRLADNKVSDLSEWDFEKLKIELEDINDIDMSAYGFKIEITSEEIAEQERIFRERIKSGELLEEDEEYQEFVEKFKPKKTTDDCYTPDNIYEIIKKWAICEYKLKGKKIIRPFYPNGNYQKETYPKNSVVIDNPPFSILSEICRWYDEHGVKYFLFAPALTLFTTNSGAENYVVCGAPIIYENGANVITSFVTNLGEYKIINAPDLLNKIVDVNEKDKAKLAKYKYPDNLITSASLQKLTRYGQCLKYKDNEVYFVRQLESQKAKDKAIYGSGFFISDKAAAEKAAAEKVVVKKEETEVWELSEAEKEIIKCLKK